MKLNIYALSVLAVASLAGTACEKSERTKSERKPVVIVPEGELVPDVSIGETDAQPEPAVITTGAGKCTSEPCFTLKNWSLDFGQTYKHTMVNGEVKVTQLDGFNNESATILQKACLKETARALRDFAEANPDAMDDFKSAGLSTVFAARVYDTTDSPNKVDRSLYFAKGSNGVEGGVSLERGKWIIQSAITGNKELDDCQILTPEEIAEQLETMRGVYVEK